MKEFPLPTPAGAEHQALFEKASRRNSDLA
jgi:hypothetical protein